MSKQIDGHKPGRYELVPVGELIPYVNNARTHSDEQIAKLQSSIREFGFVNPVLIDGNKNIIAGHGRVEAAKREGISEVPCVFVEHLTDNQRKAYILADNRLAELAEWNVELLNMELLDLEANFDMADFGFEINPPTGYAPGEEPGGRSDFNYKEQYGVIVICADEAEQEKVYNTLNDDGYNCRVVAT